MRSESRSDGSDTFYLVELKDYRETDQGPTWSQPTIVMKFMVNREHESLDDIQWKEYWLFKLDGELHEPKPLIDDRPLPNNVVMFDPNRKKKNVISESPGPICL